MWREEGGRMGGWEDQRMGVNEGGREREGVWEDGKVRGLEGESAEVGVQC